MEPVSIVTIKKKIPLFKGKEEANKIELIELEEYDFKIVSQKDLYNIGDKAVYIQPDYCLSDIPLFESFIRPNGDPSKSKLGSNNRIKAIKFNLHIGSNNPVYSEGILLPLNEVLTYMVDNNLQGVTNSEALNITKWEEPEDKSGSGLKAGKSEQFPSFMYKTDETNINNVKEKDMQFPCLIYGKEKIDGSSITIFYKDEHNYGICSRNLLKPLYVKKVKGVRKQTFFEWLKSIFGYKTNLNIYEYVESDSDFVKYGKPYLDKLVEHCEKYNLSLALRGELNGKSCKGSGNKYNPASKEENNIKFYGIDDISGYSAKKLSYLDYVYLTNVLSLPTPKTVFMKEFYDKESLINTCNAYFKDNMIEGIVVRDTLSQTSYKVMNPEYDSKK